MKARKIFALSVLAASISLAAGCLSDDDDDGGMTTPTVPGEPGDNPDGMDPDGMGPDGMNPDGTDPDAMNPDGTNPDGTDPDGMGPDEMEPEAPVADTSTNTGASVLDIARGTDADGDGEIDEDSANADLTTLVSVLGNYPDLVNLLDDEEAMLTVFAPTNDAFEAAGLDTSDMEGVKRALQYHVIPGSNISATAAMDMLDTDIATAAEGGTVQITQGDDGGLVLVDSSDANVSLATEVSASNGNATVYVVDTVLTAPPAEEMTTDPEDGGPTAPPTDGGGDGAPVEGSSYAVIANDDNLSSFETLVDSSSRRQSLESADAGNRAQVVFAPTNDAINTDVTTAVAYTYTGRGTGSGPLEAGTYTGFGDEGLDFTITGEDETLMVNGLPARFVETTSGPALYVFGN